MKNKVLKFTYTKDNGEVTQREVITITEPSDLLLAVDLTGVDEFDEFDRDDLRKILKTLEEIEKDRLNSIYTLLDFYGIKDCIKTFKNKGITGKTDETKKYQINNDRIR